MCVVFLYGKLWLINPYAIQIQWGLNRVTGAGNFQQLHIMCSSSIIFFSLLE